MNSHFLKYFSKEDEIGLIDITKKDGTSRDAARTKGVKVDPSSGTAQLS